MEITIVKCSWRTCQARSAVSNILDKYGHIDILDNVVGDYLGGKTVAELEEKE